MNETEKKEAFGLLDNLSQKEISEAISIADKNLKDIDIENEEINLQKDEITVPRQNFVTVSWVGPTFKAKTKNYGFRVMGAFNTLDEAQGHAIKINKQYPMFDTGIMQMNHFCLGYPDSSDTSQKMVDEILNKFIIKHKTIKEYKKQLFETRKNKLVHGPTKTKEFDTQPSIDAVPKGAKISYEALKAHEDNINKIFKQTKVDETIVDDFKSDDFNSDESLDLSPCNTKVHDQEYVIISYVGNEGKNKRIPINIRGVFSNKDEAEKHIENLMSIDDTYDIVVSPMYCWIPCDPVLDSVKQVYSNEKLNSMFEAHQNEAINSKSFHSAVSSSDKDVLSNVTISKDKGILGYSETLNIENDPEIVSASEILKKCELFSYNEEEEEKNFN